MVYEARHRQQAQHRQGVRFDDAESVSEYSPTRSQIQVGRFRGVEIRGIVLSKLAVDVLSSYCKRIRVVRCHGGRGVLHPRRRLEPLRGACSPRELCRERDHVEAQQAIFLPRRPLYICLPDHHCDTKNLANAVGGVFFGHTSAN